MSQWSGPVRGTGPGGRSSDMSSSGSSGHNGKDAAMLSDLPRKVRVYAFVYLYIYIHEYRCMFVCEHLQIMNAFIRLVIIFICHTVYITSMYSLSIHHLMSTTSSSKLSYLSHSYFS
jgi:hypothetical protein